MPIANFLIPHILHKLQKETGYSDDDIDDMRCSLRAILWELEKTVYFIVIFLLLGLGWQLLGSMVAVLTIRPLSGGFHSDSAWRCFWWTLLGFVLAVIALSMPKHSLTLANGIVRNTVCLIRFSVRVSLAVTKTVVILCFM